MPCPTCWPKYFTARPKMGGDEKSWFMGNFGEAHQAFPADLRPKVKNAVAYRRQNLKRLALAARHNILPKDTQISSPIADPHIPIPVQHYALARVPIQFQQI